MFPQEAGGSIAGDVAILDGVDFDKGDADKVVRIVDVPSSATCDLMVCGSAGVHSDFVAAHILAGPDYSLLRAEFRAARLRPIKKLGRVTFDLRSVGHLSASDLALHLRRATHVTTFGGMRAMEAACVGVPHLEIIARNPGEELNKRGLEAGAVVDGLGVPRVADAIEALFQ